MFRFVGITDIRFVRAEGVAMGEAARSRAIAAADLEIAALLRTPANEAEAVLAA